LLSHAKGREILQISLSRRSQASDAGHPPEGDGLNQGGEIAGTSGAVPEKEKQTSFLLIFFF